MIRYRRFVLLMLVLMCLGAPGLTTVRAQQLILVFDLSQGMTGQCETIPSTGLDLARFMALDLVDRELTASPSTAVSIVGFSGTTTTPRLIAGSSWQVLKKNLKELSVDNSGEGSVTSGLATALDVLQSTGGEQNQPGKIVVFTSQENVEEQGLLTVLSRADELAVAVEFLLFDPQEGMFNSELPGAGRQLQVRTLGCPAEPLLNGLEQKIYFAVRRQAAEYLGQPISAVTLAADLVKDLGADTYASYELLAILCNRYEVVLPEDRSMSNIRKIVSHIAVKKKERTRGDGPLLSKSYKKTVYYATDRNLQPNAAPGEVYGTKRTESGELSYGTCTVSIPESHRSGHIERPFLGLKFLESTDYHFVLIDVRPLAKVDMFARLAHTPAATSGDTTANDILVFIHGFNQSFEAAAKRTAQIAIDLDFHGAPMLYSWPSNDSLYGYWSDREDVNWSVAHLEQLLVELRDNIPDKGVHLVAHSMGNQALIGALNRIALRSQSAQVPLFKNIILAAPDFDARLFQEQISRDVVSLAAHWSIYTSEKDTALLYSGDINDAKRLGVPLPTVQGMHVIDASGVEVTPWSVPEFHSYYATKLVVIQDMTRILKGVSPLMRGLIPKNGNPFLWMLKLPQVIPQQPVVEAEYTD